VPKHGTILGNNGTNEKVDKNGTLTLDLPKPKPRPQTSILKM